MGKSTLDVVQMDEQAEVKAVMHANVLFLTSYVDSKISRPVWHIIRALLQSTIVHLSTEFRTRRSIEVAMNVTMNGASN